MKVGSFIYAHVSTVHCINRMCKHKDILHCPPENISMIFSDCVFH